MENLSKVAILAGNSRLSKNDAGDIIVEAQLRAFDAGLKKADEIRSQTGTKPTISVAFDHKGVFRKQFLVSGLTNSQKRNPLLSQLDDRVVTVFSATAANRGIALSDIQVIHEDSAKTHLTHLLETVSLPPDVARRVVWHESDVSSVMGSACALGGEKSKLSCAAITTEYFRKAYGTAPVDGSYGLLEVFFEDDSWSRTAVYSRGLQLAHLLGTCCAVRLNMVDKEGEVKMGQVITPALSPGHVCRPK